MKFERTRCSGHSRSEHGLFPPKTLRQSWEWVTQQQSGQLQQRYWVKRLLYTFWAELSMNVPFALSFLCGELWIICGPLHKKHFSSLSSLFLLYLDWCFIPDLNDSFSLFYPSSFGILHHNTHHLWNCYSSSFGGPSPLEWLSLWPLDLSSRLKSTNFSTSTKVIAKSLTPRCYNMFAA